MGGRYLVHQHVLCLPQGTGAVTATIVVIVVLSAWVILVDIIASVSPKYNLKPALAFISKHLLPEKLY